MPATFFTVATFVANAWKFGKAVHGWATDQPLKRDFKKFLAHLEYRRVLYAEWQYESMPAVTHSLSDILQEVRRFRSNHPDNIELGILLGELIMCLQDGLDQFHQFQATTAGEMKAFKQLLKIRSELAQTLAILCGKTEVSPQGGDLEKFIMDMALVRPKT
ncbi:hypothetical protein [Xanthomonas pisi]|uniref:Uncharacterized protein n=1 Tax=Xanthomonas pisi TaxID=56457 RepID=A0A2S7D580_9XANT|nr:hypothetical protein [Xanthomonas pisi]KLD69922.1 hypothetical protein Y887_14375 [Xanthomonas pisi DSM 18956]PPU68982.1 hypothetical protein XpiCFBP4643_08440 [Xanthomonas pisi]